MGYHDRVFVEDAMTSMKEEIDCLSIRRIFPRIGRLWLMSEVLTACGLAER